MSSQNVSFTKVISLVSDMTDKKIVQQNAIVRHDCIFLTYLCIRLKFAIVIYRLKRNDEIISFTKIIDVKTLFKKNKVEFHNFGSSYFYSKML